jgi:hypothetical protein
MFDPSFHPKSPLLGSQSSQAPRSRHAILLAAYKMRRRERLELERMAARTANRAARRLFAAALGMFAARLVVGTCRSMIAPRPLQNTPRIEKFE